MIENLKTNNIMKCLSAFFIWYALISKMNLLIYVEFLGDYKTKTMRLGVIHQVTITILHYQQNN